MYCFLLTFLLLSGSTLFQMSMFVMVNYPGLVELFALLMLAAAILLALAVIVLFLILRLRARVLTRNKESRSP